MLGGSNKFSQLINLKCKKKRSNKNVFVFAKIKQQTYLILVKDKEGAFSYI